MKSEIKQLIFGIILILIGGIICYNSLPPNVPAFFIIGTSSGQFGILLIGLGGVLITIALIRICFKVYKKMSIWAIIVVLILILGYIGFHSSIQGFIQNQSQQSSNLNIIPNTNYTCGEITPESLNLMNYRIVYGIENRLKVQSNPDNNGATIYPAVPMTSSEQNCEFHSPAKVGENIAVENLFICKGKSYIDGGIDTEGTVQQSYELSYIFNMDKRNCSLMYNAQGGEVDTCKIISSTCDFKELEK